LAPDLWRFSDLHHDSSANRLIGLVYIQISFDSLAQLSYNIALERPSWPLLATHSLISQMTGRYNNNDGV
jgi:hypothetical protein